MVTDEEYRMLMSRIGELKRGRHLASDPDDNSPGSIHWIDGIYMYMHTTPFNDHYTTPSLQCMGKDDKTECF